MDLYQTEDGLNYLIVKNKNNNSIDIIDELIKNNKLNELYTDISSFSPSIKLLYLYPKSPTNYNKLSILIKYYNSYKPILRYIGAYDDTNTILLLKAIYELYPKQFTSNNADIIIYRMILNKHSDELIYDIYLFLNNKISDQLDEQMWFLWAIEAKSEFQIKLAKYILKKNPLINLNESELPT